MPLKCDFMKTFSIGIEKAYSGTSITYDDTAKTFMYYFYNNHTRVYVIDGTKRIAELPQITEKIRILYHLEDGKAMCFKKYVTEYLKKDNKLLFTLSDQFFFEFYTLLTQKRIFKSEIYQLYNYYEKGH